MENNKEQQFREKLENSGLDADKIDELLLELIPTPKGSDIFFYKSFKAIEIKKALAAETDWRKRAALQAEFIGLDLE